MPLSPDRSPPVRRGLRVTVAVLIAAGYGLTLSIFYPGVMTYDAKFVYEDIAKGLLGDWQSPGMTVLWSAIDPVAPGAGSMFLLIATSYWLGFGLLALAVARRSSRLALLLPLLALMPPAFFFVGIIWRDVLFATTWLLAAAIVFAAAERGAPIRVPAQVMALALCALRRLAAPECADRRADPRCIHCLAGANFFQARGDPVHPDWGGIFRTGAGDLLQRARRNSAAPVAVDHGVRSRRH
jgi:hypothetical protein